MTEPIAAQTKRLLADAAAAGYTVEGLHIFRPDRRRNAKRHLLGVSVMVDAAGRFDGAWRTDVAPGVTSTIRTIKGVRRVLGI